MWTHDDPYYSAVELRVRIEEDEELLVYAGCSELAHMTFEQNVKGRAVHDYVQFGVDFSVEGEFRKWENAKQFYLPATRPVLFSEIIGQRCAAGYLEDVY